MLRRNRKELFLKKKFSEWNIEELKNESIDRLSALEKTVPEMSFSFTPWKFCCVYLVFLLPGSLGELGATVRPQVVDDGVRTKVLAVTATCASYTILYYIVIINWVRNKLGVSL